MKITQFKNLLSIHGADITRWDGVNPVDVEKFMVSSEQAAALYKEAKALDMAMDGFTVPDVDTAILNRVMNRIDGKAEDNGLEEIAAVHHISAQKPARSTGRFAIWGGTAMAMAAAFVLFIYMAQTPDLASPVDVAILLSELDSEMEETIAEDEIIGLWELAESSVPAVNDNEIEELLNDLFDEDPLDPDLQEEMDLWELFLQSETQET